jgi:hypothetical protein
VVREGLVVAVATLWLASAPPEALLGIVQVKQVKGTAVAILTGAGRNDLTGELTAELAHLKDATVEVLGRQEGGRFVVQGYRILEVSGVRRPLTGTLLYGAHGFVLVDGLAPGLDLSVEPEMQATLSDQIGAKVWVAGEKLVSGQIKIRQYGILRPPRRP